MKTFRYLIRNATVINMMLIAVIIALIVGITVPLIGMRHTYSLPRVKAKAPVEEGFQAEPQERLPSDYAVIGEANLFHPDRVIPVDRKAEVPRPEIVLYGTMVDTVSLAFIEDKKNPVTTPGRGNRQRVVKTGEAVSGYTVTEIRSDRIVLARGDDSMTVMLSLPDKRKSTDLSPAPQQPAQVRPVPAAPPTPARPARTVPQSPRGVQGPPLPIGETIRPTGESPAQPSTKAQPSSPRSSPK